MLVETGFRVAQESTRKDGFADMGLAAIVILLAGMSQKDQPNKISTVPQPSGKEFILERRDAPAIDTIADCDAKVAYGKLSMTIREIFPEECVVQVRDGRDQLQN
jgi:hypothetical protein